MTQMDTAQKLEVRSKAAKDRLKGKKEEVPGELATPASSASGGSDD
jgi:hypothetical protein